MAGLLEHWHRARPSSLQKATVGALGDHSKISGRSSMAGLLEHWHRARPSSLQKAAVGALGYQNFVLECVSFRSALFDMACLFFRLAFVFDRVVFL